MNIVYWSDYNCPYCYIGKTNLEKAIRDLNAEDQVTMEMKAFELDPNAPAKSQGTSIDRLMKKYGISEEMALKQIDTIEHLAEQAGLKYNLKSARFTNTFDAHRLTKYAQSRYPELAEKLEEALYRAYFTDNLELADADVLKKIGSEAGIPEEEIEILLKGDDFVEEVRADEKEAADQGIQSVPYFIIGDQYIPGAMQPEDLRLILQDLIEPQQVEVQMDGISCSVDGCDITDVQK